MKTVFWALFLVSVGVLVKAQASFVAVDDSRLQYIGRVDFSIAGQARYDWPGVQIKFKVQSPSLTFCLLDGAGDYNVFVDGKLKTILKTKPDQETYLVQLGSGEHEVNLFKRNDGNYGMALFKGLELPKGAKLLVPPPRAKRRIEFIGDSFSVGYGIEGPGKECKTTRPYENNYKAFTQVTARALKAEAHVTAISGKGVVRNYGEKTRASRNPVPYYYERTLMRRGDVFWNFQSWVPDAIVIKLGTNDHSTEPMPTKKEFENGLHHFIKTIRDKNGEGVPLFLVADNGSAVTVKRVKQVFKEERARGHQSIWYVEVGRGADDELGCAWHPKAVVHQRMAKILTAAIKKELRW